MKQIGNNAPYVTTEKTLKYQLSGGSETNYTSAVNVGNAGWIEFTLYDGSTVLDRERVPVIVDGQDGVDANLLDWIEEWNGNSPFLDENGFISPRIVAGKKDADDLFTGVMFGRDMVEIADVMKTGLFGMRAGKVTFYMDEDGNAFYGGEINVNDVFAVNKQGKVTASDVVITGGEFMGFILTNGKLRTKGNSKIYVELSSGNGNNPYLRYVDESNYSKEKSVDIGLYGSAFGITLENCDFFHNGGKYHTQQIQLGGVGMRDSLFSSEVNRITASEGGVIPSNRYCVIISGAKTQDMTISPGVIEGQQLHVINITTNHRVTVKGLVTGKDYWLVENTSNVFTWDAVNKKWCA